MHGPSNWPPASGFGGPPLWMSPSDGAPPGPGFRPVPGSQYNGAPQGQQPPAAPSWMPGNGANPQAGGADSGQSGGFGQPPTPNWTSGNGAPPQAGGSMTPPSPSLSPSQSGGGGFNADVFAAFQGLDPNIQTALKTILGYSRNG